MGQTDQERQTSLVLITVIFTSVSTLAVLLRSVVRFVMIRNPGMDDYTIIMALFFTIGYMLEIVLEKVYNIGFPASTLTTEMMLMQLKLTLSIEVTYYLIVGSIKVSIIYLYLRFAVSERFRMLCNGTIIFEVIFTAICLCVTLGQCSPLDKLWDLTGTQKGFCINTTVFFYSTSGINIITDVWILALPIKTLRLINRPRNEKIALTLIFGAGTFAAMMSVVRLQSIYKYTQSTDPFRDAIAVNVWSMLEVNTAILCASVPALKPLFTPRRLRDIRRPNQFVFHGPNDDPFDISSKSSKASKGSKGAAAVFSRKQSDATLYPNLEVETINLTKISADRSPPRSPMPPCDEEAGEGGGGGGVQGHGVRTPPRVKSGLFQNEDPFDAPDRKSYHAV